MAKCHVTTTINGDPVEFLCDTEQTLLDVLRDELQLTGSKGGSLELTVAGLGIHMYLPANLYELVSDL